MKKHVTHEHGSELLKCMVHKNALGNINGKQQKTKHRAFVTP
jgi:hypothetical protein